ncbi:uncharacterized protein LOC127864947 isoform X2 [Dreissena polymorpha]|uniref:uncharacterized protein LOC127864947 isoform X2 n=1 Tax=Dreissena polymorpha TaxID=45954 RepID=UPI002264A636|nr:uncharacterized protein LOC127864947 isoform X2 [Dreissena polymorpha]
MVNTGVVRCYSDGDASGGSSAQGGGLHRQAGHLAAPEHRGHRPTGEQLRTLGYIGSDLLRSVVVRRRFCKDFTDYMISLVTQAIRNRTPLHVPLTEESLQHIRLCAEFHGRTETLDLIKSNLLDTSTAALLVVHGISGTGKTSILAMSSKLCKTWQNLTSLS